MMPWAAFIRRPIATTLLTLGILLAGILAFRLLPVSLLPQVDFPTISVTARLPGASPETMAATVATPLERALGRIAGIGEITSSSSLEFTRITLQFDLDRDINGAARDVQAAINATRAQLPIMPSNPTYHKVNPADAPIMIIALTSDSANSGQMYDAADAIVAQKLAQVQGVGDINVSGGSKPAVRIELNPMKLNQYGIGLEAVRTAITTANANHPKGFLENEQHYWQVQANDQARLASDYIPLIVSYKNGAAVRISDIAEVKDSVVDLRTAGLLGQQPAVIVTLYRQPGANVIETVDRVKALLPKLQKSIPGSIKLQTVMDGTPAIRTSLGEIERSLLISIVLVILVVVLFQRDSRAIAIPTVIVPVSLVGSFAPMYLFGFSLNNLTLMALTVAAGFVVDDTIVVLENIWRHIESGMEVKKAALQGAREVGFTVLSMSASLIAGFIPILLVGGVIGRLFREFTVTLSVVILISLLVSLTITPMLCAHWLRPNTKSAPGRLFVASDRAINATLAGYHRSLVWALRHGPLMMAILATTVVLNICLYIIVPKGFFPQQDTGRLTGEIHADQSISFPAMRQKLQRFIDVISKDPAVDVALGFASGGQRNTANIFIGLKPLSERKVSADRVITRLRKTLAGEAGTQLFLQSIQDIYVGGRPGNGQYQYTLQSDDLDELHAWVPKVQVALSKLTVLTDVNSDQKLEGHQTSLVFDRDAMARLGLTQTQVDSVLNDAFGQRQISTIYNTLNEYPVVMEVAPKYWQSPEGLRNIYLQTADGQSTPLSAIARWKISNTTLSINHQSQFAATTLSFNLSPGTSLSDATFAINQAIDAIGLPSTIQGSFQGTAGASENAQGSQPLLILAALVAIYIILGVLYESVVHPITILSTLPSAGVGALLALMAMGKELNIVALIGVLLLIGIVNKNAIMMIDFALTAEREHKLPSDEAILQACLLRFRPIMMTTTVALFGALPLVLGHGEGAELRMPLGVSIVGGLLLGQLLTLYMTPIVYLYLDRFRLWFGNSRKI